MDADKTLEECWGNFEVDENYIRPAKPTVDYKKTTSALQVMLFAMNMKSKKKFLKEIKKKVIGFINAEE